MNPEQKDMEASILANCHEWSQKLADFPISLSVHIAHHIGFYRGFCNARGWETSQEFLTSIEQLTPRFS